MLTKQSFFSYAKETGVFLLLLRYSIIEYIYIEILWNPFYRSSYPDHKYVLLLVFDQSIFENSYWSLPLQPDFRIVWPPQYSHLSFLTEFPVVWFKAAFPKKILQSIIFPLKRTASTNRERGVFWSWGVLVYWDEKPL